MALLRGYLYVIADKGRTVAKIGMARDVHTHFQQLSAASPLDLELVSLHPCTYVRFREFKVHKSLNDLYLRQGWFRWDEVRIQAAITEALAVPETVIKTSLKSTSTRNYDFPVKRADTGEVFPTTRDAAEKVLGSRKLATKIRRAVREGVKCGPCLWERG